MKNYPGFEIPERLSQDGIEAAKVITRFFAQARRTNTGGCRTFYSPAEWAERGEKYGCDSLLVVVHDGGDVARTVNLNYGNYQSHDRLEGKLTEAGFYMEACTCWYAAVYRIRPPSEDVSARV